MSHSNPKIRALMRACKTAKATTEHLKHLGNGALELRGAAERLSDRLDKLKNLAIREDADGRGY